MVVIDTVEQLADYIGIDLSPYDVQDGHERVRMSRVCMAVAHDICRGSQEAATIAVAVILRDPHLPFGKLVKSKFARSLKKRSELLSDPERQWFLYKTAELLTLQFCPREVEDYCKLVKKLGIEACTVVVQRARPTAPKSQALSAALRDVISAETSS